MDNDSYTEISSQGWFSRIGDSIKGILFGLFLFVIGFPVLWFNEERSVERYNSLQEGQGAVVSVGSETIDSNNNQRLIHTQGRALTAETLNDNLFKVSINAIKLQRQVQMYQWRETVKSETKEELGGGTKTKKTYSYSKEWSDRPIDSSRFKQSGYNNPAMNIRSKSFFAKQVTLGAYRLNNHQIEQISGSTALTVEAQAATMEIAGKPVISSESGYYLGANANSPEIGDYQVSFSYIVDSDVSVIAQQLGQSFGPYQTEAGGAIDLLESKLMSAEAMFASAHKENEILTWILRLVGFLLMWFGLSLIFRPLAVVASVVPFIGNLVAMGGGILAFFISLPCALVTIAIAWISFRPLLAGILIGIAVVTLIAMKFAPRKAIESELAST